MPIRYICIAAIVATLNITVQADETLYRYEGDVLLHDPSTGWVVFQPCEGPCSDSVENGRFVLLFTPPGILANYHLWMDSVSAPIPDTAFWAEWRFHSNHPLGPYSFGCDGSFTIEHANVSERFYMYGDAVISFSGDDLMRGLALDEFHTFRLETLDGATYRLTVDGTTFVETGSASSHPGYGFLQLFGGGGCEGRPNTINEWDYVRYGNLTSGELIVSSDPPAGTLNNIVYPHFDRFTVTFDSPSYVLVDDITVTVTGGVAPAVIQTRRRDNGAPETVEIVLDRAIPVDETTTFTFNDAATVNVIEYTLVAGTPSDPDGDGVDDLLDNCPGHPNPAQADCDGDGVGDVCTLAECAADPDCGDCDGDTVPDGCQPDADGDSVIDVCDRCPGQDDRPDINRNGNPDCLEPDIIPTTSGWGLAILAAALLVASRIFFGRRRRETS